jgi:hypothetical protein
MAFPEPEGCDKGRLAVWMLCQRRTGVSLFVSGRGESTKIREHPSYERNALPALRAAAEAPVNRGNGTLSTLFLDDRTDLAIGKSIAKTNVHSTLCGTIVNRSQSHSSIVCEMRQSANKNLSQ